MKYLARLVGRLLVLAVGLMVIYQAWLFGHVVWWVWFNPRTTAFMDAQLAELQKVNWTSRQDLINSAFVVIISAVCLGLFITTTDLILSRGLNVLMK